MRKVDKNNLFMKNKRQIDWNNSIEREIPFEYDEVHGVLILKEYYPEDYSIRVEYNNRNFILNIGDLSRGRLGKIFHKIDNEYSYNVGYIINNKEIIKLFKDNTGRQTIGYKCLECGYEGTTLEHNFKRTKTCPCCDNKVIVKDINSIWATRKDLIKYFKNEEDAYNYSHGAEKRVDMICPICKTEKKMRIADLSKRGFSCDNCGKRISYPERFIKSFLDQLNVEYKREYSPIWANGKRYDFYLRDYDCIIETHGLQHYEGGFERKNGRNVEQEQENDEYKSSLALNNNISNYIIIDCKKSEKNYIKQSIIQSDLFNLLNVKEINWDECSINSLKNMSEETYLLKQQNPNYTGRQIAKILNIAPSSVSNYLRL